MDPNDPEIRAFIRVAQANTFSAMAEQIRATFGADRAWPVDLVAETYRELNPRRRGSVSRYEKDAEVMQFIRDRTGLRGVADIRAAGVAQFGDDRFPSRSHVHRIGLNIRMEARRATARLV